jgi:hypothetical protein
MMLQHHAPSRALGTGTSAAAARVAIMCTPRPYRGAGARPAAAPLGSTMSVDGIELPAEIKVPKEASKEGKVLHPDLINPNILKTQ